MEARLSALFTRPEAMRPTAPSLKEMLSRERLLLQPAIIPTPHTIAPVPLRLLTLQDQAIRLPTAVQRAPVTTPSTSAPQDLPQHPAAANREVLDPCGELMPQELPQHSSQVGVTIECVHPEIRRRQRSMKKHKLLKLRKKNKVKIEHRILMDITRKEKAFMMEQMAIMREADAFNAEKYVQERLNKLNTETVPEFWKGRHVPKAVVMEELFKAGIKIPGYEK